MGQSWSSCLNPSPPPSYHGGRDDYYCYYYGVGGGGGIGAPSSARFSCDCCCHRCHGGGDPAEIRRHDHRNNQKQQHHQKEPQQQQRRGQGDKSRDSPPPSSLPPAHRDRRDPDQRNSRTIAGGQGRAGQADRRHGRTTPHGAGHRVNDGRRDDDEPGGGRQVQHRVDGRSSPGAARSEARSARPSSSPSAPPSASSAASSAAPRRQRRQGRRSGGLLPRFLRPGSRRAPRDPACRDGGGAGPCAGDGWAPRPTPQPSSSLGRYDGGARAGQGQARRGDGESCCCCGGPYGGGSVVGCGGSGGGGGAVGMGGRRRLGLLDHHHHRDAAGTGCRGGGRSSRIPCGSGYAGTAGGPYEGRRGVAAFLMGTAPDDDDVYDDELEPGLGLDGGGCGGDGDRRDGPPGEEGPPRTEGSSSRTGLVARTADDLRGAGVDVADPAAVAGRQIYAVRYVASSSSSSAESASREGRAAEGEEEIEAQEGIGSAEEDGRVNGGGGAASKGSEDDDGNDGGGSEEGRRPSAASSPRRGGAGTPSTPRPSPSSSSPATFTKAGGGHGNAVDAESKRRGGRGGKQRDAASSAVAAAVAAHPPSARRRRPSPPRVMMNRQPSLDSGGQQQQQRRRQQPQQQPQRQGVGTTARPPQSRDPSPSSQQARRRGQQGSSLWKGGGRGGGGGRPQRSQSSQHQHSSSAVGAHDKRGHPHNLVSTAPLPPTFGCAPACTYSRGCASYLFGHEAVKNNRALPADDLVCVDEHNGIYVCDVGLTPGQCADIIDVTERSSRGTYAAYTYAKQTLGCREHDELAAVCSGPVMTACATIRERLNGLQCGDSDEDDDDDDDDEGDGDSIGPSNDDVVPAREARPEPRVNRRARKPKELVLDDREPHLVKYDVSRKERQKLDMHTDKSEWTFLISLSEGCGLDYEGGGTYFEAIDATVHLQRGHALIFPGKLRHRGQKITAGYRFLLVGFLVDKDGEEKEKAKTSNAAAAAPSGGGRATSAVG